MRPAIAALATLLLTGGTAAAQSAVSTSPTSGHPGLTVAVSGSGYGAGEAIDVYVDTVDTLLLVSTAAGRFTGSVTIPASAGPGNHYITAIGRHTGDAAQKGFTVTTAWAQYGFDAGHSSSNPYENTISAATAPTLGLRWTAATNSGGATPAVTGGRVYVSTHNGIQALATATGATLWNKLPGATLYGSPAASGSAIFVASFQGNVYSLNAATGATNWTTSIGTAFYSSPAVANGTVYVGGLDGNMYAVQLSTGAIRWTVGTQHSIDGSATVVNNVVYFGSGSTVYAVDTATASVIWTYATGGGIETTPAVVNNVLYVGANDGKVYAIDTAGASPGTLRWSFAATASVYANPAVANGVVYAGSASGIMYALDARTGAARWTLAAGGPGQVVRSAAVANGVVCFTSSDGTAYAVDAASGNVLASGTTGSSYFGGPSVADGAVYVSAVDGNTYAFATQAGLAATAARAQALRLAPLHPDMSLRITR